MIRNCEQLAVTGVALEGVSEIPCALLESRDGSQRISIPVGAFGASAILVELEELVQPKPEIHDLMAAFFKRHGFHLDRLEIYGLSFDGYLARLLYHRRLRRFSMEVRPSDGIPLALRLCAPILADQSLLEIQGQGQSEVQRTQALLFPHGKIYSMRA